MLTQVEVQQKLTITAKTSFMQALEELFVLELDYDYISYAKLNDNKEYSYFDTEFDIEFKTQINIARSNYTPEPLKGKNIPKLHCPICFENIGIPGKENLRVFEFKLRKRDFFIQLTPFPLFPYHFVAITKAKTPMAMDANTAADLVEFIKLAPNYVACSNSDVAWAGSSVLQHHHYQVIKNLKLPIMQAKLIPEFFNVKDSVEYGLLNYPIATAYVAATDAAKFIKFVGEVINNWKNKASGKNTCNLIIQKYKTQYQAFIILRNPDYRTPSELTDVKQEGVGIIEVAGEGIYPVPSGDNAADLWKQIEKDGLNIIKGIINGNNPVARADFSELSHLLFRV